MTAAALLALAGLTGEAAMGAASAASAANEQAEAEESASRDPADAAHRGKAFWEDDGLPPVSEEQKASRTAVSSGQRAEVKSLTTATSQLFANPDGTFTVEASTEPERVRKGEAWVPVDTTLIERKDGSLAPRAGEDIELSGGGTREPLARLAANGKEFAVSAPWDLPKPTVQGSTAVYSSVLPDVDLAVTVTSDGFTYHLVVHSRKAAANTELKSVKFPVTAKGLSSRATSEGSAAFVDSGGRPVVHSGAALMWDSAAAPATPAFQALSKVSRSSVVTGATTDALSAGAGSRTEVMDVTIADDALTVVPDQQFLADEKRVYPVVLDPPAVKATLTSWTTVWSDSPKTSFWKTSHALGVGYDAYVDNKKARSFFQFDTRKVSGKKIINATFTAYEIWSANCDKRNVELWRTGQIYGSTTWSEQPSWKSEADTVSAAKGHSSSCPDGDVEFDATSAVAYTAKAKATLTTLGLRASESDPIAWKQFMSPTDKDATSSKKPRLSITYVSVPTAKPSSVKMSDPKVSCSASGSPAMIRDATPRLTATPTSADGSNATVRPNFELYKDGSATATTLKPSAWTASGTAGTVVTSSLAENTTYRFRARTEYKYSYGGKTDYLYGPWSSSCYFRADTHGPAAPTISSSVYTECVGDTCEGDAQDGSVGMTGTFLIKGSSDVRRYDWWLNGVKAGSKTFTVNMPVHDIKVTPDKRLTNTLRVQTFDAAGNAGSTTDYLFNVARAADPVGVWKFDESSGTTSANAAGDSNALRLSKAAWTAKARHGAGFKADGTATAATSGPVVDTTKSFAVSAWAKLDSKSSTATVLNQNGAKVGAFQLYYSSAYDRWVFNRYDQDSNTESTAIHRAMSSKPGVAGAWTHLLGVQDLQKKELRLYVNGHLEDTTGFSNAWAGNGAFEIGRFTSSDGPSSPFTGDIDQVQAYNRVVFPDELWALANIENPDTGHPQAQLLADWSLDETSGTTAADGSGRGNQLSLKPGAAFTATDDPAHGNVVELDTAAEGHATAGVELDNSGSFTVAGWVNLAAQSKLDDTTVAHSPTLFAHPGAKRNAFRLWYRQEAGQNVGDWNFGVFGTDVLGGPAYEAASDEVNPPDGWVHVVGVYDSAGQSAKLYVTGERQGDEEGVLVKDTFQPTGPLMMGRARRHDTGEFGNLLPGQFDDLRVYAGVLSEAEITQLATVDEPPVPIE
ncbi:LamG-like jellyroll fold domain-containing protein [Streptomyces sp. NPDC050732]|uniref:LamG-like jellyroll fold domain-containing protein n=1 Tax=Streptomyces sp. NPDC050732 TaxID=3154632 RepID=UPI0034424F42